ncbi:MAG TPA: type II toxin-antitoxin system VapC family toxin [Sedimentisphaerales bacterium]|nr:type II toxin-antitoxin system VapC family toxin [Sedimentisphaerales bacterium]
MRDFLIDTNIWEYWFNEAREPQHSNVLKRVSELRKECEKADAPLRVWISSVTWGEVEYGYEVQTDKEGSLEAAFREFIHAISPMEFVINKHVTGDYGRIRARLFEKYGPKDKRKRGLRPEQLIDPVTSLELKIQENDLWIVSQAVMKDLTLVTNDRKSLQPLLEVLGSELHIENWATDVKSAAEIMEVGKDVVKRMEQRRKEMKSEGGATAGRIDYLG